MSRKLPLTGHARGILPLAPEGWPFLIGTAFVWLLFWSMGWSLAAWAAFGLLMFMLNFFRDPERRFPTEPGVYVAPADGKVIRAGRVDDGMQRVDIFMNVFDVHVNRAPMAGRIEHMSYTPGRFVNASFDHASHENERNRFELRTEDGRVIGFTQIAGLVARRIVSYVSVGDHVNGGQRIGMIRFGSRVDCEIPDDYELCVQVGQRVRAGETILARPKAVQEPEEHA
ncbi:MAG: phosphatidylserine decarboxylase family protein [Zetaproteobacteria bacterium]|nr:MAG: phosphatidylserine decarboxylase family protein [Zetaproteobacteria bacterium]